MIARQWIFIPAHARYRKIFCPISRLQCKTWSWSQEGWLFTTRCFCLLWWHGRCGAWCLAAHDGRAGPKRWRVFPVWHCISFFFRVGAAARNPVHSDVARHLVFLHFTVIRCSSWRVMSVRRSRVSTDGREWATRKKKRWFSSFGMQGKRPNVS